jgi:hypothetical protein
MHSPRPPSAPAAPSAASLCATHRYFLYELLARRRLHLERQLPDISCDAARRSSASPHHSSQSA